jgi:kinesin family protein C1
MCRKNGSEGGSVDFEKAKEELQANMLYSDQRDHKEILVSSSTTSQERKEFYNFWLRSGNYFLSCYLTPFQAFKPKSTQAEVFQEISQLAQSCTDGVVQCLYLCIRANWVWKILYDSE